MKKTLYGSWMKRKTGYYGIALLCTDLYAAYNVRQTAGTGMKSAVKKNASKKICRKWKRVFKRKRVLERTGMA